MPAAPPQQRRSARLAVRRAPLLKIMVEQGPITHGRAARSHGAKRGRGVTQAASHAGYEMDETSADEPHVCDISLDSPPKIVGNQRQQPDIPSTSLLRAHSLSRPAFMLPQTSRTPIHDSHDLFRTPPNHVARCTSKPSSVSSSSSSRSISTSSAPPSTLCESYIAKLNAHHQAEQHWMVYEQLSNERADAAIIHQRSQELKALEIRLLEAEAETLRLKIEYYKLTNSHWPLRSG